MSRGQHEPIHNIETGCITGMLKHTAKHFGVLYRPNRYVVRIFRFHGVLVLPASSLLTTKGDSYSLSRPRPEPVVQAV
jgi:hypothetical protein